VGLGPDRHNGTFDLIAFPSTIVMCRITSCERHVGGSFAEVNLVSS